MRSFCGLTTLMAVLFFKSTIASADSSRRRSILQRQLSDRDRISSIGGSAAGAVRPSLQTTEQPSPAPTSTANNNNNNTTTKNVTESGPKRRKILPFTLSLWPVDAAPSYQQQIAVRDIVESFIRLAMTLQYSPDAGSRSSESTPSAISRSAVVSTVNLMQVLDVTHIPDDTYAEITMEGMVYFDQASTNLPTSEELTVWIVSEALPTQGLVQSLKNLFPTLSEIETYYPGNDFPIDTSRTDVPSSSPTFSSTIVPTEQTDSPTEDTTLSPTSFPTFEVTDTPTGSPTENPTESPTETPTESPSDIPSESPTETPNESRIPVPPLVIPAPSEPVQTPTTFFTSAPPMQSPSALLQPVPSQLESASAIANPNSVNSNVLIGCAVAALVALILGAAMLVKINKTRRRQLLYSDTGDDKMGMAVLQVGTKKSDGDDKDCGESASFSSDPLVKMDVAKIVNLEDEEVVSGYVQKDNSRESFSWGNANRSGASDVELGNAPDQDNAMPRSPSQVSTTRSSRRKESEVASKKAASASSTSMWSSFFGKSKNLEDGDDQESLLPPDATQTLGSASAGSTDGGVGTDGTFSDFEDVLSIDPDIVSDTKTIESFEKRARQDYVVKKDMLESSATAMALAAGDVAAAAAASPEQKAGVRSNPPDLALSNSEVEEERQKNEVMLPNPYFRRPFNGTQPPVDKSSSCALQPTDTSAATLAQRAGKHLDEDEDSPRSNFSRMVPRLSSPKSWWRHPDPSKKNGYKKDLVTPVTGASVAPEIDEEDTTFGPSPSDGWDPADCDMGSNSASLPTEEMFKLTVDNKTGQSLVDDNSRNLIKKSPNQSTHDQNNNGLVKRSSLKNKDSFGSTAGIRYADHHLDGAGSVSSEESSSLKLDSSFTL
ncbi:WD40-repeat-containing domain protein [Nitzschia inconspicua]|uniref:WD40-repeat-containing domain protein n=1 Tax=Nitzschia inconspicua TaxID=303405 RepID=A0A9K3M3W5_9STRA|nr:WD40-repeat-containing domain protein [Nitzschia inconspicua]